MLRSLPVSDPIRLYRVGDGDACCVMGGPRSAGACISFPLFERLKAELPEFEEVTAFQAGCGRLSVQATGRRPRPHGPLRSEYVTGNYFSTLGVGAFGGRVFTPRRRHAGGSAGRRGQPPRVAGHLRRRPSRWSAATFVIEGAPVHRRRCAPPGFFGETLRRRPARPVDSASAGTADRR